MSESTFWTWYGEKILERGKKGDNEALKKALL